MSQRTVKAVWYTVGLTALGTGLFYFTTPSEKTFTKMNENQGIGFKDISDSERNTKQLLTKLKQGAGLPSDKKS